MTDVDGERALVGIMSELAQRPEAANSAVRSSDMECTALGSGARLTSTCDDRDQLGISRHTSTHEENVRRTNTRNVAHENFEISQMREHQSRANLNTRKSGLLHPPRAGSEMHSALKIPK